MTIRLPNDVARCRGVEQDGEWREGCEDCARRLAPAEGDHVANMEPPPIVVFVCEGWLDAKEWSR